MRVPPAVLLITVLFIGFLFASTAYFYSKQKTLEKSMVGGDANSNHSRGGNNAGSALFSADLPQPSATQASQKIEELTKPAEPKGRLSYPENVYTVGASETLFGIGQKFGLDWKIIKLANGISNENVIQSGYALVMPKIDDRTDLYRIVFKVDDGKASQLNRELRDASTNLLFNPIEVAKKDALAYFGLTNQVEYNLLEQDESKGTALVEAKTASNSIGVGLFQPKVRGRKGFWAVLYIELRK